LADQNAAEQAEARLRPPGGSKRRRAGTGHRQADQAAQAQLNYVSTADLQIRRLRRGRGFRYVAPSGKPVSRAEAKRLASLAVPPA
jgi:DNA topoisomerase-1